MTKFYANPYSVSAHGFYFSSPEGYEQKAAKNIDPGSGGLVEEYSFDFIDGSDANQKLWSAISGSGGFFDIERWYEELEGLSLEDKAKLYWLYDNGVLGSKDDLDDALAKLDDISLFQGSPKDYAHDLIDDIGVEALSNADYYFDYEKFGRDLAMDMDADDEADAYYLSLSDRKRGEEYVDSMGSVGELGKKTAEMYFDYDALVRDMEAGGDITEFDFDGNEWVVTNANHV